MSDPVEENEGILRGIAARGVDLGRPFEVDFSHVFDREADAQAFAEALPGAGFAGGVRHDPDFEPAWDVTVTVTMVPEAGAVTAIEAQLGDLARAHGGEADGWGFLSA